ncbi:MAG: MBL fold metallo-hydrolase [Candidatus Pacebacteria bacterium]|nr:MBL fold metallo-hydrolase [Candidatus Paceibacterota bacterium]
MEKSAHIKYYLLTILILALANVFVWQFIFGLNPPAGGLKVVFFDIGQGDSIFIETAQKHQILIDGGPSNKVVEKLGKQMPFWDKTIDLVVLTHSDYDHLRGLLDVLDNYQVENILWTGEKSEGKTFENWLLKIKQENANIILAKAGILVLAGKAKMEILYPLELQKQDLVNNNKSSIAAKLSFGNTGFFFTGDIDRQAEQNIILQGGDIEANVLKVSHHGSKSATSPEFLANVQPQIAVISVGKDNKYGHPHQEVLSNLLEFDIKVLRTDLMGDVKIVSNGQNLIY